DPDHATSFWNSHRLRTVRAHGPRGAVAAAKDREPEGASREHRAATARRYDGWIHARAWRTVHVLSRRHRRRGSWHIQLHQRLTVDEAHRAGDDADGARDQPGLPVQGRRPEHAA